MTSPKEGAENHKHKDTNCRNEILVTAVKYTLRFG